MKKNDLATRVVAIEAEGRKEEAMEEGYKAMAEENRRLAEQFLPIVVETWAVIC